MILHQLPQLGNSAQRLTASMVWTHYEGFSPGSDGVVLNALRHQWFGHGVTTVSICAVWVACSTPYGINGLDTYRSDSVAAWWHVLNALRHQWFGHQGQD